MHRNTYIAGLTLVAVVVGLGMGWLTRYQAKLAAVDERKEETVAMIRENITPDVVAALKAPTEEQSILAVENFFTTIQSAELFRGKVYDANKFIVWSNIEGLSQTEALDNDELDEALEGESEIELKKEKEEHLTERQYADYTELYVPIMENGAVIGVFEVYQTMESIDAKVAASASDNLKTNFMMLAGAYVVLLLAGLFFFRKKTPVPNQA